MNNKYLTRLTVIVLLFIAAASSESYSQTKNNFIIKGMIKDMAVMPTKVYLIYPEYFKLPTDSATVTKGTYTFSGHTDEPTSAILALSGSPKKPTEQFTIFLAEGEQNFTSVGSFEQFSVTGSGAGPTNEFLSLTKKSKAEIADLNKLMASEQYKTDIAFKNSIIKRSGGVIMSMLNDMILYARHNPDSAITPFLISGLAPSPYITPEMRDTLMRAYPAKALNGRLHQQTVVAIQDRADRIKKAADEKNRLADEKIPLGSKAMDFTANNTAGKPISLSSFKGKYVLIDFWASWCVPCRAENPNVVKAYAEYKDKGFTVLGFSLDAVAQKGAWLTAIKKDGLTWTQLSDLKGWKSEIAKLYFVDAIPQNFLIDPNGNIVAKNLRGDDLQKKLESIFKK